MVPTPKITHIPCVGLAVLALGLAMSATPVMAQEFPLTIEHKFGTTIIPQKPERVATVDSSGADNLLALGIQPVAIEKWYGDYERALWPWAEPLLKGTPVILDRSELNFELIASSEPDVIISLWNSLTPEEYKKLSLIAPVVAVPEGVGDFALPWDERALIAGRAVGQEAEATKKVEAIRARVAQIAAAHPDWQGKTVAVAVSTDSGTVGAYTSADARPQLMRQLGFVTNPSIDAAIGENAYFVKLSLEALEPLDADLLMWIDGDGDFTAIETLPSRPFMNAHKQGREMLFGKVVTGAFAHGSLLSLPHALDHLVPAIEAALDGNPDTHSDDRSANF